jgi:Flp pilus assembly protein CpaB
VSSRRTAILIGAIVIGVIAVLLIVRYVNDIENRVNAESAPATVFVARENIPRGTDGTVAVNSQQIVSAEIPQKYRPGTAIQSTDAVEQKVAVFDIAPNTVIVEGMFVDPSTVTISFRERLDNPDHVAISIQVEQVKAVGGFIVPGDEVNLMVYQNNENVKEKLVADPGEGPVVIPDLGPEVLIPQPPENIVRNGGAQWVLMDKTARVLYQKVQVLAVGQNQLLAPGESTGTGTGTDGETTTSTTRNDTGMITFNVPPKAAQWIATWTQLEGGFYLSLVGEDYEPRQLLPLPIITDQLPGEDQAQLTPYFEEQE